MSYHLHLVEHGRDLPYQLPPPSPSQTKRGGKKSKKREKNERNNLNKIKRAFKDYQ